jgi:hypothetical protein
VRQLGTRGEPYLVVGFDVEFDFLACEGADSVVAVSSSAGVWVYGRAGLCRG